MKYKYPKISNFLIYRKTDTDLIEVTDFLEDETYLINESQMKYAGKLDGKTNPCKIDSNMTEEEIKCFIDELDKHGLLKEDNKIKSGKGTVMRGIWEPVWTIPLRITAFLWNNLLMLLWLPFLVTGLIMFGNTDYIFGYDIWWIGTVLGLVSGIVLHELGHAFAAKCYGARVFEVGLLTMAYVIPGAYVMMDISPVKERFKKIQIYAAGVESNFLLAGVFLILASVFRDIGYVFFNAALNNIILGVVNLTFIKGLDGTSILEELLGVEDIIDNSMSVFWCRGEREVLSDMGTPGYVIIAMKCIMGIFNFALVLYIVLNVLEVVLCFV